MATLNSHLFRFFIDAQSVAVRGNFSQLHSQYVELFPISQYPNTEQERLGSLAANCQENAKKRQTQQVSFHRRIPDLSVSKHEAKLSTKLQEWWNLADFVAFRAEVKKCFKNDIPPKERSDWEDMFVKGKEEIAKLSSEIKRNEDEINAIVYKLFDLTPEEIVLLETSIGAR